MGVEKTVMGRDYARYSQQNRKFVIKYLLNETFQSFKGQVRANKSRQVSLIYNFRRAIQHIFGMKNHYYRSRKIINKYR